MFCKWCGNDIPNGKSKCPSCGKVQPPVSECGGFYDLVPKAKALHNAAKPASASAADAAPRPAAEAVPARAAAGKRKDYTLPLLIAFLATALLLIVMIILNANKSARIAELENKLAGSQQIEETDPSSTASTGEIVQTDGETTEQSTEQTTEQITESVADLLSRKLIEIEYFCSTEHPNSKVTVKDNSVEGLSSTFRYEPSDDEEEAKFEGVCSFEGRNICEVEFEISEEIKNKLKLEVEYDIKSTDLLGDYISGVEEPFTLRWRFVGEDDWKSIDESDGLISQNDVSKRNVEFEVRWGKQAKENRSKHIEVQIEINRANEDGGALKIVIGTVEIDLSTGNYSFK